MRIVYDDAMQTNLVHIFNDFMKSLTRSDIEHRLSRYDYGMERVQSSLLKKELNNLFHIHSFSIGETVTHDYGIGNNCQHPVYYHGNPKETQQVCYISLNSGLYGECYTYLSDYNQTKISKTYELSRWGIK